VSAPLPDTLSPHTLDAQTVAHRLHSSFGGLDARSARDRRTSFGPNRLPQKRPRPQWLRFFDQLCSPVILILSVAAIAKLFLQQMGDAAAILFVVFFNAALGFIQERKAEASLSALRKLSALRVKVVRDGAPCEVDAEEVVPGDVLLLESGCRVAADARLIETHALDVNESMLTGESTPVRKTASALLEPSTPISEQNNMVFAQTTVIRGRGRALVTATGMNTEVASILAQAEAASPPKSTLEQKMTSFAHTITVLTLLMVAVILVLGPLQGYALSDLVMTCVSLAVSAVPEGLPIAITIVLSHGLFVMAKRSALVRRLDAVETLGCTTVICTDKTGTLTENQMTVGKASVGLDEGTVWAARIAFFCSEGHLGEEGAVGDPVDTALMQYALSLGALDSGWKSELILPFEPDGKVMACAISKDGVSYTVWKGALDAMKGHCRHMWNGNSIEPFDAKLIENRAREMTEEGLKVLCLAYGGSNENDLTLVGLVGLFDPPREGVREAIVTCQKAGIRVVMVTGDDPRTALAIAQEIGLDISTQRPFITGIELDQLDDRSLSALVNSTSIFARVLPHHKLRIVRKLQENGAIVAMTGDGINDAPPLRQADIGIAMGDGTDVAKEAAAMVVVNNSFSAIVDAIRQGRVIYRSLQQMVVYLLTTCFGGVMTIGASILLAFPLPILPLQLLWINLVTDGTTTIPLSLEGEHGDIMKASPRPRKATFISLTMLSRSLLASVVMMLGTIGLFSWVFHFRNGPLGYARTVAFTALSLFQILNALNARSVRRSLFFTYSSISKGRLRRIPFGQNRPLLLVLGLCLILQILAVELPFLQEALETTPLALSDWLLIGSTALVVIISVEIHKAIRFFFCRG
jgi:calcium-translocating P-type ATPase